MRTLLGAPDAPGSLSSFALLLALACVVWSGPSASAQGTVPRSLLPGYADFHLLIITELQTNNRGTLYDGASETDSWLELYNPGQVAVLLDDFALTDEYSRLMKWRFPPGWAVPPGEYLVVWMDGQPRQTLRSELHSGIRLNPSGGSIALSKLVRERPLVVDYFDYPGSGPDLSVGVEHLATGGVQFQLLIHPSPGAANSVVPAVILNEWYVNPGNEPGWCELYNPSSKTVDLSGMFMLVIASDVQWVPFSIPKGRKIPAHGFLRVWADAKPGLNDTDGISLHAPFILPSRAFTLEILLPTGLLISQVTSKASDPFHAEARFPDGANFYENVDRPTPAAPNVGRPRFVTVPPQSESIRLGQPLTLKTAALGTSPIRYQWYLNEQLIPGATSSSFSLSAVKTTDQGSYMLIASNVAGSAYASSYVIVAFPPRVVVDAPTDISVPLGKSFQLPASVTGSGQLQVQWKRNGMNIPRETLPFLVRNSTALDDGGLYTLVAVNEHGATVSAPVRIIVEVPTSKMADAFADRLDLGNAPQGIIRGSNRTATRESKEPQHAGNPGGRSVWFQWTPIKGGIATFNTRGSTFDTLLGVYTGTAVDGLKRVESDDDGGAFFTSELKFNANPRLTYAIAVDGYGADNGDFLLSWSLQSTDALLPVILTHPASFTAVPGSEVSFAVKASANTVSYQWLFNGRPIRGGIENVLTLGKVDRPQVGLYSVLVTSSDRLSVESHPARLELGDLPRVPTEDKYFSPVLPFTLPTLAGGGFPELAGIPTVSVAAGTIGTQIFTTDGSSTQFSEPPPCGRVGGFSRFQTFVLAEQADLIIDTIGSSYNTTLTVYALGSIPPLKFQYVDCDKNGSSSLVQFTGTPGTAYYAFVDSADGSTGQTVLNWRCGALPHLLTPAPPITNTVTAGTGFSLPTTYAAAPPVSGIQWLLNGDLTAGNTALFTVPSAGPEHTGNYSIILSNAMGSVTGMVANLYVDVPFELSVTHSPSDPKKDVLIQGLAEQGFLVEASEDLANWCAFYLNPIPLDPFSYTVSNPEGYRKLFFRCHPWPIDSSDSVTPCATGFP